MPMIKQTFIDQSRESSSDDAVLARLLAQRFSCRAFTSQPVPDALITRLFEMAQLSASWCNSQPWGLIVTRGAGTERFRAALSAYASTVNWKDPAAAPATDFPFPAQYTGIYKDRQRQCGKQLYESIGVARHDQQGAYKQLLENFKLFNAPHATIITTPADLGLYGAVDCGSYVSNLMLAARSLGIASIALAALAGCSDFIRSYFAIPEDRKVLCGFAFGYADEDHPINKFRTPREDLDAVIQWEQ